MPAPSAHRRRSTRSRGARRALTGALALLVTTLALLGSSALLVAGAAPASASPVLRVPSTVTAPAPAPAPVAGVPAPAIGRPVVPEPAPVGPRPSRSPGDVLGEISDLTRPGGSTAPDGQDSALNSPISIVLLLGAISLVPALLIMMTAFTRIVIVLGFVRSALGTNGVPPNQVIIGLALFLSLFVMAPTFSAVNDEAVQPYRTGEISQSEALSRGIEPFREFMSKQVRDEDLSLFIKMSGDERPANITEVKTTTLVPAFVLSELRTAFLIGFVIFIPFIIIDLIVSAALSAMGMVMLPPVLISLPFKLLLFVAADGWSLVVQSLLGSFAR